MFLFSKNIFFINYIMVHLTEEQFAEHASRLMVIVNNKCGYELTTNFHKMGENKQKFFNTQLNKYIKECKSVEDIVNEFNEIVNGKILNEDFQPECVMVRDTNPNPELLLTDEQKEHLEEERIKNGWDEIKI
jgi:hypothetical protein